jgi:hypothetical protein
MKGGERGVEIDAFILQWSNSSTSPGTLEHIPIQDDWGVQALPYLTPLPTIPRILAPDMVDELWGVGGGLEYGEGSER